MMERVKAWVNDQLALGEFSSREQVLRRSAIMALRIAALAYFLNVASHLILYAAGVFPYDLPAALVAAREAYVQSLGVRLGPAWSQRKGAELAPLMAHGAIAGEIAHLVLAEFPLQPLADLERPVQRVGAANTPVPYARNLEADFIPQQADIEAAARKLLG